MDLLFFRRVFMQLREKYPTGDDAQDEVIPFHVFRRTLMRLLQTSQPRVLDSFEGGRSIVKGVLWCQHCECLRHFK